MKTKPQILPEELLIEILLRLPVKSLVRFKCVSKAWFSLIANPHFAHSHFNLALAPTHRLLLFSEYYKEFVSLDFNAPSLYDDIVILNFSLFQSSLVRVIGSCRGFILYMEGYASLFILNPSTGVHKELPSPASWDCLISPFLFGFGYEPSTDDYLVTLVYSSYGDPEVNRAEIFSVRANKWKEVDGVDLSYLLCGADDEVIGLQFGRAIHWLHYDNDRERMPIIVAFDLVERVFYKIPLPNDFDGDIEACQLQEIGGHLGIYDAGSQIADSIWVMEEYKMQLSWTRRQIVMAPHMYPVCITKSGDVVGRYGFGELVKFNYKGEVLEHRHYAQDHPEKCFGSTMDVVMHIDSLLPLPCDS